MTAAEVEEEDVEAEDCKGAGHDSPLGKMEQREGDDDGEHEQGGQDVGYPYSEHATGFVDSDRHWLPRGIVLPPGGGDIECLVFRFSEATFAVGGARGTGTYSLDAHLYGARTDSEHFAVVGGYCLRVFHAMIPLQLRRQLPLPSILRRTP